MHLSLFIFSFLNKNLTFQGSPLLNQHIDWNLLFIIKYIYKIV